METTNLIKNKITYSSKTAQVINDVLLKYKIKKTDDELLSKLTKIKNFIERKEVFENLPERKLSKIVKQIAEGRIPLRNLGLSIKKELKTTEEISKKIAKELEEKVFIINNKNKVPNKKKGVSPGDIILKNGKSLKK